MSLPTGLINVVNVWDYAPVVGGVPQIGQGSTDDTNTIRAALTAYLTFLDSVTDGIGVYTQPVLYFPKGKYVISDQIDLGGAGYTLKIMGDDAIFTPGEVFNDHAFFHGRCYDVRIEGLNFVGFKKGVYLGNLDGPLDPVSGLPNPEHLDTCQWSVTSCSFQNCEEALTIFGLSALVNIERCKFYMNDIAVKIDGGDKVIMRDNWITSGHMSGAWPAQIHNSSAMVFESNLLVPLAPVSGTKEPAWINNYASVTVLDVRQGAEDGSFTLVNNFAGVGNLAVSNGGEATTVTVKDSQCYAVYGSIYENSQVIYAEPAIVRFVGAIPNQTCIENNRGMVLAKIMGFSKETYGDDPEDILDMIYDSGAPGAVTSTNVCVAVLNNAGALTHANGSHVPSELWDFVRDDASIWPAKRSNGLAIVDVDVAAPAPLGDGSIVYTFDYGAFNVYGAPQEAFLVNYSGNPNYNGLSGYSGGFVGLLKANGFWAGTGSDLAQSLVLETLFNQAGDPDPLSFPTGTFTVDVYWEASGTAHLPPAATNHNFCIKITGRSGDESFDSIKVTPLDSL